MEGKTTDGKLLAQDDIDTLLGEAGIEGSYESEELKEELSLAPKKRPIIRFAKRSDDEVSDTMALIYAQAVLEREDDVKVIWNAMGTIPMVSGFDLKIHDMEYVTLGVLYENHLVVKSKGET